MYVNNDHIFMFVASNSPREFAACRTDGAGNLIATFFDCSGNAEAAHRGFNSVILEGRNDKVVIVSPNGETGRLYTLYFDQFDNTNLKNRAWIELSQLAWSLQLMGLIHNRSVQALGQYYGIETKEDPTCKVQAMSEIYWTMMNRSAIALRAEGALRRGGGAILNKIFQTINGK